MIIVHNHKEKQNAYIFKMVYFLFRVKTKKVYIIWKKNLNKFIFISNFKIQIYPSLILF